MQKFEEECREIGEWLESCSLEIVCTQIDLMSQTTAEIRGVQDKIKMVVRGEAERNGKVYEFCI